MQPPIVLKLRTWISRASRDLRNELVSPLRLIVRLWYCPGTAQIATTSQNALLSGL